MNEESWEQLQQQLANVLADTFHGHDGSVVNRWVVLADVMDQQGPCNRSKRDQLLHEWRPGLHLQRMTFDSA